MKRTRHTPEQIVLKLREADRTARRPRSLPPRITQQAPRHLDDGVLPGTTTCHLQQLRACKNPPTKPPRGLSQIPVSLAGAIEEQSLSEELSEWSFESGLARVTV